MKARVIVTMKCNRKCKGCCNEHLGEINRVAFEDLFKYDEISITGGEPMLMSERVVEMVHRLRLPYTYETLHKQHIYTHELKMTKKQADTLIDLGFSSDEDFKFLVKVNGERW